MEFLQGERWASPSSIPSTIVCLPVPLSYLLLGLLMRFDTSVQPPMGCYRSFVLHHPKICWIYHVPSNHLLLWVSPDIPETTLLDLQLSCVALVEVDRLSTNMQVPSSLTQFSKLHLPSEKAHHDTAGFT